MKRHAQIGQLTPEDIDLVGAGSIGGLIHPLKCT
jgi:hypothetical protein